MCRHNDIGAYSLANIYCDTRANNMKSARQWKHWHSCKLTKIQTPHGVFNSIKQAAQCLDLTIGSLEYKLNKSDSGYFRL